MERELETQKKEAEKIENRMNEMVKEKVPSC